jgi:endonuclease/exonuclease/phosphatase (EEP) superfamily protein YafD
MTAGAADRTERIDTPRSGAGTSGNGVNRARPASRFLLRVEQAMAWIAALVAMLAAVLGLLVPRLGGSDPGLPGLIGFASETVTAMWLQGGALSLLAAGAALWRHQRWPAAVLAAVAAVILLPELRWWLLPPSAPAGEGDVLRVATMNLAEQNLDDPGMPDCLRDLDADVLVLTEYTWLWAEQLESHLAGLYPHHWVAAAKEPPGYIQTHISVWSRLPAAGEAEVRPLGGINAQLRVPLVFRGHTFALYGIHPWKPYGYRVFARAWRERRELLAWTSAETLPVVVAGDCNATPRSAFLLRLREQGLTLASEEVCGRAPVTWPMDQGSCPLLGVAIDHVLHGKEFQALSFRCGMRTRSDHVGVVAGLVWRDR